LVIAEGTQMHGKFADEHEASRKARSGSKPRPEAARRPHLHDALKPCGTAEVIHAFDRRVPQRNPGSSPNTSGAAAPEGPPIRHDDDGHFFVYNGTTYNIGSMLKSDPGAEYLLSRNGIVHDLRNLLQVLSSGVGVAENRIQQGRADEVPQILRKIGRSVERASALLRQMVRIPRSPVNKISAIDIGKMFAALDAPLRWALGPSYELVIAIAPDLPPVYCVEGEFENVVLNLVINARDAMPTGGRTTIEVTRGARSGAGGGVILRIHDTGTGMDRDVAAKAFKPYFTTKSAGTGLGLAMVAAFARSLGGSARIEQTSTKGTTIALYLPSPQRT
jgi:histidine kinase/DNA gyrase B/HSP90-like ATPase